MQSVHELFISYIYTSGWSPPGQQRRDSGGGGDGEEEGPALDGRSHHWVQPAPEQSLQLMHGSLSLLGRRAEETMNYS